MVARKDKSDRRRPKRRDSFTEFFREQVKFRELDAGPRQHFVKSGWDINRVNVGSQAVRIVTEADHAKMALLRGLQHFMDRVDMI